MVEGNKSFVRFDLAITRDMHLRNIANNTYPVIDKREGIKITVRPEGVPTFKDLKELLERVGKPYNWHLREEYFIPESVKYITEKLAEPTSKRFTFMLGKKKVGGAIIANIEPDVGNIFAKAHDEKSPIDIHPSMAAKTLEIYKIGLYPEYTKRGWGTYFLPQLLTKLFNSKANPPEVVYLNTRNTNHGGVLKFYTGFNMNVIHGRSFPNDLISEEEYQRHKASSDKRSPNKKSGLIMMPA